MEFVCAQQGGGPIDEGHEDEEEVEPDYNYTLEFGGRERSNVDVSRRRLNSGRRFPGSRDATSVDDPSDSESTGLLDVEGRQNV